MHEVICLNREREISEAIEAIREIVGQYPETVRLLVDYLDALEAAEND